VAASPIVRESTGWGLAGSAVIGAHSSCDARVHVNAETIESSPPGPVQPGTSSSLRIGKAPTEPRGLGRPPPTHLRLSDIVWQAVAA
jgi:hypothetical protein